MAALPAESVQQRVSEKLSNSLQRLVDLWNEIGIFEDQRDERLCAVVNHLQNLMDEMVQEEESLHQSLVSNIKKHEAEVLELAKELDLPPWKPKEKHLILIDKELRLKVDDMRLEKDERLAKKEQLQELEHSFCLTLSIPPLPLSTSVPSKDQLHELEQHIQMLQGEKETRMKKYCKLKESISQLMKELEVIPRTSLEEEMFNNGSDCILTPDHLQEMQGFQIELEKQRSENIATSDQLRQKLQLLWNCLDEPSEHEQFMNQHQNCGASSLKALRDEVARCEGLKLQNIKMFVEKMRDELVQWWEKCCFGEDQKKAFLPFYDEEYSEELLKQHECEVSRLMQFYQENQAIFEKVIQRENLWSQMLVMEQKAVDPNRFRNRGGALLREERERRKLLKDLPQLERELAELITCWEEREGKTFYIHGRNFLALIQEQWNKHQADKEKEKERRRVKQEDFPRTTPRSATKRHLTPNLLNPQAKCRLKEDVASATLRSIAATPNRSQRKKAKPEITPKRPQNTQLSVMDLNKMEVISEKQGGVAQLSPVPSLCSINSYTDFKNELNTTHNIKHSSMLLNASRQNTRCIAENASTPKSRPVRPRGFCPPSKRGSPRTPIPGSARLAVPRGKNGLPFLI